MRPTRDPALPEKVILDCDPGIDDAFAIMLAAGNLDLLGITTVGGNSPLEKTTPNARVILDLLGRPDIPVHSGHAAPLVVPLITAPKVHGENGLGDLPLPPPSRGPDPGHAVDFIIDTLMSDEGVTLVATGPLTNIAAAIGREPRIVERMAGLAIMGGSATYGNWTPTAEFNIFVDPEAAYRVFESGARVRMAGLNLTQQAHMTARELGLLEALPTKSAAFAAAILRSYMEACGRRFGLEGADIHDAVPLAWLIDPRLVKATAMHVAVELHGQLTRGMTVCDCRHLRTDLPDLDLAREPRYAPRGRDPNAEVGLSLDFPGFMTLLLDTLSALP